MNTAKQEVVASSGGNLGDSGGGGPDLTAALGIKAEKRKFNAKLYGRTVQKGFAKLYKDATLSDLTLIVGTERIPVHRMVLCAWSETFRAMLEMGSSWKESTMNEIEVNIEEEEYAYFKQVLEYMYTGNADFINGSNIVPLIALSNYYGIDALKEVCGKLLGANISDDNLFFLLDIVDKYDCSELEKICGRFLASNFAQMWEEDETRLLTLRSDTWAAMLGSDDLAMGSEQLIFEAVMAYAAQYMDDPAKRDDVLTTLLPNIRYTFLSPEFLVERVEKEPTIQHLPIMEKLLYEAYRYRAYPYARKLQPSFSLKPRLGFQKWDEDSKGGGISVSNEGLTATATSGGWESVRALLPVSPSTPYFEIKLDNSSNTMLGVCVGTMPQQSYAGQYNNGFTLHGADGNMYHAGNNTMQNMTFATGDTVGIYVDLEKGQLTYYKNGTKSFVFSGVDKDSKEVYPVASFAGSNKVTLIARPNLPLDLVGVVKTKGKKGVSLKSK